MLASLVGYRTYIVAGLGIVYALSAYVTGHVDMTALVQLLVTSFGLAGLRSAVSGV